MNDAISRHDKTILRYLAKEVAEAATDPIMEERRNLWKRHNALERVRPMILVFPEGSWRELLPPTALSCEGERAREMEAALRRTMYYRNHLDDDTVIEREWVVTKAIRQTGWGLDVKRKPSHEKLGAYAYDPVLLDASDLKKLRYPEVIHDEAATRRAHEEALDLFGDILNVKLKGRTHIGFHLAALYCNLRGLEQAMLDMCMKPNLMHDAMAFFEEGHRRLIQQYEEQNLLSLNNDGTYHSSGGVGYTDELPLPDCDPEHPRPKDLWASAEAQEWAQVGPEMHAEFTMQYEKRLLEPFGLNGYGCCEPLDDKLDDVLAIPNIRRVSISPFSDVEVCAQRLGARTIFSWKPHPSHLVGDFDEEHIRGYIQHALEATQDCVVEMILKDTHTCENHPERFTRWTQIAREVVGGTGLEPVTPCV